MRSKPFGNRDESSRDWLILLRLYLNPLKLMVQMQQIMSPKRNIIMKKKLVRLLNIYLSPTVAPFRTALHFTISLMGALFLVALKKTTPTEEIILIVEFTILFMLLLTDLCVRIKTTITQSQTAANKKNPKNHNRDKK